MPCGFCQAGSARQVMLSGFCQSGTGGEVRYWWGKQLMAGTCMSGRWSSGGRGLIGVQKHALYLLLRLPIPAWLLLQMVSSSICATASAQRGADALDEPNQHGNGNVFLLPSARILLSPCVKHRTGSSRHASLHREELSR